MQNVPGGSDAGKGAGWLEAARQAGADCLRAALQYLQQGWSALAICPPDHLGVGKKHGKQCTSPGKAPWGLWKEFQTRLPTEDELRQKWKDNPTLNVGVALGPVSGLVRVDVDGPEADRELQRLSGGDLPLTLRFTGCQPKYGLLFAIPPGVILRTTPRPGGIDIAGGELRLQAQGAQTVLPPSRHPQGCLYQWVRGQSPDDIPAAAMPGWLVDLMRADAPSGATARAPALADGKPIRKKTRNSTLTSLAGSMRRRGMSEEAIAAALLAENAQRCKPPLDEAEVRKIARSVARYEPAAGGRLPTGYDMILQFFGQRYRPPFRRGEKLFSETLGREVSRAEACYAPPIELVEQLLHASDVPRDDDRKAKRGLVPKFFKTWAPSAWADLLGGLKDEEATGEISRPAGEEFAARVAAALHAIVALGYHHDGDDLAQVERRSLVEWCWLFAKIGRWETVRSYRVWCTQRDGDLLGVALRAELFDQLHRADLGRISPYKFGQLAELYGIGRREKVNGVRVVVLAEEFLADVWQKPCRPQIANANSEDAHAHARENAPKSSTEESSA
jgi:putative DNA primase/helicase